MSPIFAVKRHAILRVWLCIALLAVTASAPLAQERSAATSPNRVLELDGEGAHVELPVAAFEGLREATVEAWVRWDDWGPYSQWFAYGEMNAWRGLGLNHFSNAPVLQFFIYPGTSEDLRVVGVQTSLPLQTWHHMASVSGSGGMRLYLDGTPMGSDGYAGSFANLGQDDTRAFLGRSTWEVNAAFRGALDEVRLWSAARGADEIRADMARALRGDEPGLAGLWSFDAGDARDGSGHGHDGTLHDGARCEPAPYPGAQPRLRPAWVHGEVLDESGVPVPNARVRLIGRDGDAVEAGPSPSGQFSVAVLDTGAYTVEVLSAATRVPRREVSVAPGADLLLDLRPPPPDLVARWSADVDARDEIGQFHGELSDGVTFAPGVAGQAFQFSGDDGGRVRVPNAPELNPEGSFSLVAWIYPETDRAMYALAMWGDYHEWLNQRAYALTVQPGRRLNFNLSDTPHQEDGSYHQLLTRPNVLPLNAWTLVAAVWDAASGERRLYANGLLVARRVDTPGSMARSRADLAIGHHLHEPGRPAAAFVGRIDETALYGVDLSGDEITRLYSAHAQARWRAEGNSIDATRSGHDGVAVGGVSYTPGVVGQSFSFDGRDSYVEFDPRIGNYGGENFSMELWLHLEAESGAPRAILAKGTAGADALSLSLDGAGHLAAALEGRQDSLRLVSGRPLAEGVWHHVVLVREGRQAQLYLDGELDGSAASERIVELQTPGPLLLGGMPQTRSFAGRIDEVALHRRPLSADEIRATHDRVVTAWRWNLWRTRLQTWGSVALVGLLLLSGGRFASQHRARRRQEAQLGEAERARQAADDASAAKSAFLAHVSHEIRTPLNAMLGHAQVLRDRPSMTDADRHSLEAICENGGHLLQLLNDVLDLSKVEAGHLALQPTDFYLGTLLQALARLFEPQCRQKGLRFRVEADANLGAVRGDEGKLRQVLVNLLGNAVKFSDVGEVVLRVTRIGSDYFFEVQDSGPGVAPEARDTIFQPFQQGPLGLAAGGTGLGLSIARRHVEMMGGRLELVSTQDRGSCFCFYLSLQAGASLPPLASAPPDSAQSQLATVESFDGLVLPAALRARLRQAAQMQNLTEVKLCLEQLGKLGEREARLATTLTQSVRLFDLGPVLRAVEGTVDV